MRLDCVTDDLWSAGERARLEALAQAIEAARRAAAPAVVEPGCGRPLADRPLDWERLSQAACAVLGLLRHAGVIGGAEAAALIERLSQPATLAALVAWATRLDGPPPFGQASLAWEVVRLALPPFLAADRPLTLDVAQRGCPSCGGAPDLALLAEDSGARTLICALCDTDWAYDRVQCPFCGTTDQGALAYLEGGPRGYRIRVCDACGGYLKTIDRRERPGTESPLLLRMLTAPMDVAAQEAGYRPGGASVMAEGVAPEGRL